MKLPHYDIDETLLVKS